ncbi:beta-ketoacyl-[acyl-carrier-protein] synthase family protein [Nocardia sp. BSTN01]|uniref:beta-ketoacyl-[acyl-carrier-protein] synthase family protein n=1 Tax=Nocardia sp. BSTN01 TaxID=2783665 RepID=UPI00188EB7AA|nr:beta-ketoacyl-[acyl-carrier-protein] synthase family protein [Nocardia sp. BSTN01]MBF5002325.1 beta-ketoacyl-[acyl-carrier-protein] synthase family protein [Nocardia sp. BSTN01]
MNPRTVVVTGVGLITGLGIGVEDCWAGMLAGLSAVRPISTYDPTPLTARLAAEIDDFEPLNYLSKRTLRTVNRGDQLAVAGARLALRDAGLPENDELGPRTGLFLGANKEISRIDSLIENLQQVRRPDGTADLQALGEGSRTIVPPLFYVEGLQSASLFHISQIHGIRGVNAFFAGTADASSNAIGRAMRAIRRGDADVALAGGSEDATGWWSMSKMDSLGVLTPDNGHGAAAFRPFDTGRSGAVLGEGAAILVLEERERALARGARIYAEVSGYGAGNDLASPPKPDREGTGVRVSVARALDDAKIAPGELDYVVGHGSATRLGDLSEAHGLHAALGGERTALSVIKPQTGHLVGAAGAMNAAAAALSVHHGIALPILNLDTPDRRITGTTALDLVRGTVRETTIMHALALGRGLEGQSASVVLSRAS